MARKRETHRPIADLRATDELVRVLLKTRREDVREDIVYELQWRGDDEVFSAACALCQSPAVEERETGVRLLSQNIVRHKTLRRRSIPFLLELIKQETQPEVLAGLGHAFGHLRASAAVRPLRRLRKHTDAEVRWGVVMGLSTQTNTLAIKTLIEMTQDKAAKVRDWATFNLGNQIDTDTPEIREALVKRLKDRHYDTRCEALVGLARRKDERVIPPLIKALTAKRIGSMALEAAQEIGDPRLLPALNELQCWLDPDDRDLQEAIKSCSSEAA